MGVVLSELPVILKIVLLPTKLFQAAFRHSQGFFTEMPEWGQPLKLRMNPLAGFRISFGMGLMATFAAVQSTGFTTLFLAIVAYTGLSCAWQLGPFCGEPSETSSGRVPRPGVANWILAHHAGTSAVLDVVGNSALALSLASTGAFNEWNGRAAFAVVLMVVWLPFNRFVFTNLAVLRLLKFHAASQLHFAVFRRFQDGKQADEGVDERHRQIVLPVLGAFGKVRVPYNESLAHAPPGANLDSEEINAEVEAAIKLKHDTWVHEVTDLIRRCDVAVFHWEAIVSESMRLEYALAQRIVSPERIILVVDAEGQGLREAMRLGLSLSVSIISLGAGYGSFLRSLRSVLLEMSSAPARPAAAAVWSESLWTMLNYFVREGHPGASAGIWRLPPGLGHGECEFVMAMGLVLGRGRDDTGWFQLLGRFIPDDPEKTFEARQHYAGGEDRTFRGTLTDGGVRVRVGDGPEETVTSIEVA